MTILSEESRALLKRMDADDAIDKAVELALEAAAKACEDTDIVEGPSHQSYYCQLGDAAATRAACADAIRSLKDSK